MAQALRGSDGRARRSGGQAARVGCADCCEPEWLIGRYCDSSLASKPVPVIARSTIRLYGWGGEPGWCGVLRLQPGGSGATAVPAACAVFGPETLAAPPPGARVIRASNPPSNDDTIRISQVFADCCDCGQDTADPCQKYLGTYTGTSANDWTASGLLNPVVVPGPFCGPQSNLLLPFKYTLSAQNERTQVLAAGTRIERWTLSTVFVSSDPVLRTVTHRRQSSRRDESANPLLVRTPIDTDELIVSPWRTFQGPNSWVPFIAPGPVRLPTATNYFMAFGANDTYQFQRERDVLQGNGVLSARWRLPSPGQWSGNLVKQQGSVTARRESYQEILTGVATLVDTIVSTSTFEVEYLIDGLSPCSGEGCPPGAARGGCANCGPALADADTLAALRAAAKDGGEGG